MSLKRTLVLTTLHGETNLEDLRTRHQARVDKAVADGTPVPPAFVPPQCDVIAVFTDLVDEKNGNHSSRMEIHTAKWEEAIGLSLGMRKEIEL